MTRFLPALLATALLLPACGSDDGDDGGTGSPPPASSEPSAGGSLDAPSDPEPESTPSSDPTGTGESSAEEETLATLHAGVFAAQCASCHGFLLEGDLDLTLDGTLRGRLLQDSIQLPGMPLVDPGDPANSYLWHKVANTHVDVGGSGDIMPPTGSLPTEALDRIEAWIAAGAPE